MTKYLLTAALVLSACGSRVEADGKERSIIRTEDSCEVVTTDPRTGAELESRPCDEDELGSNTEAMSTSILAASSQGQYGFVDGLGNQGAAQGIGFRCDQAHSSPDCIVPVKKNFKFWWLPSAFTTADGILIQNVFTSFINYVNADPALTSAGWHITLDTNDEFGSQCLLYSSHAVPRTQKTQLDDFAAYNCTSKILLTENVAGNMFSCRTTNINLDMAEIKIMPHYTNVLKQALWNGMAKCMGLGTQTMTDTAHASNFTQFRVNDLNPAVPTLKFAPDEACLLVQTDLTTSPSTWQYNSNFSCH